MWYAWRTSIIIYLALMDRNNSEGDTPAALSAFVFSKSIPAIRFVLPFDHE